MLCRGKDIAIFVGGAFSLDMSILRKYILQTIWTQTRQILAVWSGLIGFDSMKKLKSIVHVNVCSRREKGVIFSTKYIGGISVNILRLYYLTFRLL